MMNAIDKYDQRCRQADTLLCVGLDSAIEHIPERFRREPTPQLAFNRFIIEQTHAFVSAYKPNIAFYEARGAQGLHELQLTLDYLRNHHPDILTICDAKRGDNANTNRAYVSAIFDRLGFDAVTLHPYLGRHALEPFLERAEKACIIVCRTSHPAHAELQERVLRDGERPLWQVVAESVRDDWNANQNCMLVVGATLPDILQQARALTGSMPILAPGLGSQGAELRAAVRAGISARGRDLILSASRSVIFHADPAAEAKKLRDSVNDCRRSPITDK
jgi:orotidine-5'-phosphate decarboxylase